MEGMKSAASGVVGDLARARIALDERGQKLGELEERTAAMMASADSFSKHAHDVHTCHFLRHLCIQLVYFSGFLSFLPQMMIKYKDKKWYQLWWHLRRIGLWNHANHQCLLKTAGPPFLFSISLHRLSNKQLNCSTNECFSPQRHIINFALPQQPLTEGSSIDTGWPKVMRTERNGRIYTRMNLSFQYTWWS